MNDNVFADLPANYKNILHASKEIGFTMPSDLQTGSLLKTLIASKPAAKILELGTGTGLATSWLLAGMDANSKLVTIDNDVNLIGIAKQYLTDNRIQFVCADGYEWLLSNNEQRFDIIFADAMPGKYDLFENTWHLLNQHGIYIIDDMLPQPNWPEGHARKVDDFIAMLTDKTDAVLTKMNWSTGIIVVTKKEMRN